MTELESAINVLKARIIEARKQFNEKYAAYEDDKTQLEKLEITINQQIDELVDQAICEQKAQLKILNSMKKELAGSNNTGTRRPYIRKEKLATEIETAIKDQLMEIVNNPSFVPLASDVKMGKILSFINTEVDVRFPGTRKKTRTAITELVSNHVMEQLKLVS